MTLTASGAHTILIDHNGGLTNGMTLRLYDVSPDLVGAVASNGTPFPVSFTSPGQNARPTFNSAAGLRASLRARQPSSTVILSNVAIIKPDGTNLTTATTLYLYDMPPDVAGAITINGSTVSVGISTPGQNAGLSFNVAASQTLTINISSNTIADPITGSGVSNTISILNSGGATVYSASFSVGPGDLAVPTARSPGNYTLKIDPTGAGVGNMSVRLTSP